jgi:hypothetical protein
MWYFGGTEGSLEIGYATSEDGSSWTKCADNPVLLKGDEGSWDGSSVWLGRVIDSAGINYKMWYCGSNTGGNVSIGYAESDTRDPVLIVPESKPVYDSTDTIVAQIVLDGTIYIVPEGTSQVVDSILKYMVASAEASANTETEIPLTDCSIGKHMILGVSSTGFVSTNPYLIEVVADADPPELTLGSDTVYQGDSIYATSDKNGTIFLVEKGTPADLSMFLNPFAFVDSLSAQANMPVEFPTNGLSVYKDYWLYAVDIYGFISKPDTVTVEPPTGVEESVKAGIIISPNPAIGLLSIETTQPGKHIIEITSLNGQLLYTDSMEGPTHQVDLSSFQKGLYIITVRSRDYTTSQKLIKVK